MTDNKTQLALLVYGVALLFLRKKPTARQAWLLLIATLVMMAVYLIPHSI